MEYAIVIPARYESSRFPGKPLVELNGKTMIQRVWERCCEASDETNVYIATDSELIQDVANSFGANVIMTSSDCLTGTDRIAEANKTLKKNFVINVQGDEPLINPLDIKKVIDAYFKKPGSIVNAMCRIESEAEFRSTTIPKVVTSKSGKLIYMSRAAIPTTKACSFEGAYKQVCIYAFSSEHLEYFYSANSKTPVENIEDIEILRFLEGDFEVQMIEVESGPIAIDIPEDVDRVLSKLSEIEN